MNTIETVGLSVAEAKRLWQKSLMYLYLPVVIAGLSHLLLYPVLAACAYFISRKNSPLKVFLVDRFAAKLLFCFSVLSFVFLVVWLYFENDVGRTSISLCYVVAVLLITRRLERLAYQVWRNARSSYHV